MKHFLPFVNKNSSSKSLLPLLRKLNLVAPVLLLLALVVAPVQAAVFTANDHDTLVTAITSANGNSESDTITIEADITLTADLPDISTYIAFRSSDGNRFTISGNNARRIFKVPSGGRLSIQNLVLANGNSGNDHGGAIHVTSGELELLNAVVRNSTAGTAGSSHSGGGIYVTGTASNPSRVSISTSSIHNNLADYEGGGIYAHSVPNFSIFRSAVYSNESKSTASGGGGLVLRNHGDTPASYSIVNSSIFSNKSASRGAGIFVSLNESAITSEVTLRHVTITANTTSSTSTYAGAGLFSTAAKVTLQNSIIYGNKRSADTASNCIFNQTPTSGGNSPTLAHNIIGAGSASSSAPHCGTAAGDADPLLVGPSVHGQGNFFIPRAGSPAIDTIPNAACFSASEGGDRDQRGRARPNPAGGACDKGAIEDSGYVPRRSSPPGGGGPGGTSGSSGAVGGIGMTPAETCADLMKMAPAVEVSNAGRGTACQEVEPAGYGHPDLAAEKPASVVDVWGEVTAGTQVCFQGTSGKIRYVDTSNMKRTVTTLSTFRKGNMICATIGGPGQVALVQDGSAPGGQAPAAQEAEAPEPAQQQAAQPAAASNGLNGCMVKTQGTLNFRQSPGGDRQEFTDPWGNANAGWLPAGVTLTAVERSGNWLKVDYYGTQGWISASYVTTSGSCG